MPGPKCSVVHPDAAQRFAEVVVDHLAPGLGQAAALACRGALQAFLAAGFDGRHHIRHQCAGRARLQEQSPVKEQRRITRILAADALRDALNLSAVLQEVRGGPLQFGANLGF